MEATGKDEVKEQVAQAVLIAILTGLINWGFEAAKERLKKRRERDGANQAV